MHTLKSRTRTGAGRCHSPVEFGSLHQSIRVSITDERPAAQAGEAFWVILLLSGDLEHTNTEIRVWRGQHQSVCWERERVCVQNTFTHITGSIHSLVTYQTEKLTFNNFWMIVHVIIWLRNSVVLHSNQRNTHDINLFIERLFNTSSVILSHHSHETHRRLFMFITPNFHLHWFPYKRRETFRNTVQPQTSWRWSNNESS